MKQPKIDPKSIENKWQDKWANTKLYSPENMLSVNNNFYNLWMFPYPSAEGLHAGHAFASTGSDVLGRFTRMHNKTVFQPIGYDSFGIHSENYAIKVGDTPQNMLKRTTKNYERQLRSLGHGYDWNRTLATSDTEYYKWTQWVFIELFKAGLAYRKTARVNWCPSCKTVLADEQVINGKCERCGSEAEDRNLEQWFFQITEYADKLLSNLNNIDWPDKIKKLQANWIGKKEGINIDYPISNGKSSETKAAVIKCWTSRPETNFGATFIVLAPEHPYAEKVTTEEYIKDVDNYIKESKKKSREERISEGKVKTGVFTGSYAVNRLTNEKLPIWISDFVITEVGSGAVVGVPGHDKRDFEFAKKFDLPIKRVVKTKNNSSPITKKSEVQESEGKMINSDFLNGLDAHKAKEKMIDYLETKGWGKKENHYHLRDWLISRQRYWGPPIPMIYCEHCAKQGKSWFTTNEAKISPYHAKQFSNWENKIDNLSKSMAGWYPEENLPVKLPIIADFQPKGEGRGPLASHTDFYEVECPSCGRSAQRETDVSDTFLDSAWYFLRYPSVDTKNSNKVPFDTKITKKWLPVSMYFGGQEHAVLHLMYSRFVTQVLHDLNILSFNEPFPRFFAHGLMIKDGAKMSKSRGNVVNPDQYIEKFGADTLRLYLMFLGPMDGSPDFRDSGIEGMSRFIDRVWAVINTKGISLPEDIEAELVSQTNLTIKKVTTEMENIRYNTAIAALMEFVNYLREIQNKGKKGKSDSWRNAITSLTQMLAPFAPHIAEEAWCELLGRDYSVHTSEWPKTEESKILTTGIKIAIQINGKIRSIINVNKEEVSDKVGVINKAKADEKIKTWLNGKIIIKEIYVTGKVVNFVV